MKKINKTYYQCEGCNTRYDAEEDARLCEESHILVKRIISIDYAPRDQFPYKVTIELENNRKLCFKRC